MPQERATGFQNARKLTDHTRIVTWIEKEAKRREEIDDCIEAILPSRRQAPHVALCIAKVRSCAASAGDFEQVLGVIEPIDVVSGLGEKVRVPALAARDVENSRSHWKAEHVDDPRCFLAIPLECEDGLILEQIMGVEIRLPPFGGLFQKKTGSR